MSDFIKEGWQKCNYCGNEYLVQKVKYPERDLAHDANCPYCKAIVFKIPRGTDDYDLFTKEEMSKRQKEYNSRPNCPECGSKMEMREGPYSNFWGCSKFPRCNGTRKIEK